MVDEFQGKTRVCSREVSRLYDSFHLLAKLIVWHTEDGDVRQCGMREQ